MSALELVQAVSEIAVENLKKYGHLTPVAFLLKDKNIIAVLMLTFQTDDVKYTQYYNIGEEARKRSADAILIVSDVAMREYKTMDDVKYMLKNYATEAPLSYPESMRQDGIFYSAIDLMSGKADGFFQRYVRLHSQEDIFKFFKIESFKEALIGDLQETVLKGFRGNY